MPRGSALQGARGVARGVFWGSFYRVSGMHCFPGFPLEEDTKGDIKGGQQGQTLRAANRGKCNYSCLVNSSSVLFINKPKILRSGLATSIMLGPGSLRALFGGTIYFH